MSNDIRVCLRSTCLYFQVVSEHPYMVQSGRDVSVCITCFWSTCIWCKACPANPFGAPIADADRYKLILPQYLWPMTSSICNPSEAPVSEAKAGSAFFSMFFFVDGLLWIICLNTSSKKTIHKGEYDYILITTYYNKEFEYGRGQLRFFQNFHHSAWYNQIESSDFKWDS